MLCSQYQRTWFRVEADASEGAIGAVLSQEQDGKWRPISFLSKSLSVTERNYEIYNKELLAIMLALEEWRHYLMGVYQDFEIWTDHQNLQYFRKPQKVNRRQAQWITKLAEYHFTLHHKASTTNKKADLLSQQADHDQGQDDNNQVIVLSPEHFKAMIMPTIEDTHRSVKTATRNIHLWDNTIPGSLNHDRGMKMNNGLIWYNGRIYVPRDHALCGEIIAQSHDHITAGHPGIEKTKELVLREFWWPKMKRDIEAYVQACKTCQQAKSSNQAKAAPLHPNEILSRPWTHISVDMVTGLPKSNGHDAILIIVDHFSKEIIPVACSTELSSEGWVKILCDKVYAKHGMPQVVISDRGTIFVSKFMKDLYDLLQIKGNASTAYHPQTDRQMERVNQEIEKYLCMFVNHLQTNWAEWLSLAAFAHNNCTHSSTGKSPFKVNYGYNPAVLPGTKPVAPFHTPASNTFVSKMREVHATAKKSLEKAALQMKAQYDKSKWPAIEYKAGDKVWLDTTNLHLPRPKKKLDNKRTGPFEIKSKKGTSAYTLKLLANWKIHPTFNESLLTPYIPPAFPNQEQPPPPLPDLINSEEVYEIEKFLNSRQRRVQGKQGELPRTVTDYFIKWKGYGPESNSWVQEDNMDADELIEEFLTEHIDLITTDKPDATIIIMVERPDGEHWGPREGWQYLI